jgi:hypothetical protein
LVAFLTSYFLASDKRLTSHPGGLIALIFLFLGGFLQMKDLQIMICRTQSYKMFGHSLKLMLPKLIDFNADELYYYAFATQIVAHYVIYEFFMMMYLFLCVCFSWDLYQTIKNPLYPPNKRLRWYIITSVLLTLGLFALEYKLIKGSIFVAFDIRDETQSLEGYMQEN